MFVCLRVSFRVATWSRKTKKNDKSQVKTEVLEKSQEKILKNIRFCQFKYTKFLIFKSLPLEKN